MKRGFVRRFISSLCVFALSVSLVCPALADDEVTDPPVDPPPKVPYSVEVSFGDAPSLTAGGATGTLTATAVVKTEDGETIPDSPLTWEWTSGDETIATVSGADSTVTITPLAYGKVDIKATATVTDTNITSGIVTKEVTILPASATGISITPSLILPENGKSELTATLDPITADSSAVEWVSSNTAVADITPKTGGTVTVNAKHTGKATITASIGGKSAPCEVTVAGLELSKTSLTLSVGNSESLTVTTYGLDSPTISWELAKPDVARVTSDGSGYTITGLSEGTTSVKFTAGDSIKECTVTVKANTAGVITENADAGHPLRFSSIESQINDRCHSVLNESLHHVSGISVPTDAGTLYYHYVSADNPGAGVGSTQTYYTDSQYGSLLSDITFVPQANFSGTAVISYTGYSSSGTSFKGEIRVTVEKVNDVVYSTGLNTPLALSGADFNSVARSRLGRDMSYVTFTLPSSSRGVLYYRYSKSSTYNNPVDSSTQYKLSGTPLLSDVTFVPAKDYSGTVTISYTCYDNSSNSFSGRVSINVAGSSTNKGDIEYSTAKNKPVSFVTSHFNDACKAATGETLDRVKFETPDSSKGTLYYDYSSSGNYDHKVSNSNSYYRNSSYYISDVDFVPASGYSGTLNIGFTGWSVEGTRFTGTVRIKVGTGNSGDVSYSTDRNQEVKFDASDFNDVSRDVNSEPLDYVRFTPPSSSKGTLYYNYSSSGSYDSKVSSSTSYYRNSKPYLSDVSFVPAKDFTGSVSISFTGYDTAGARFSGTVEITVGENGDLTYSTDMNKAVKFASSDFNSACEDAVGGTLNYVRFELPSSSRGKLYLNYSKSSSSNTAVSESTSYYRNSSPSISNISFVPAEDYTGTTEIDFTGWNTSGTKFEGVVTIIVGGGTSKNITYSVTSGKSVTFSDSDFNTVSKDVNGIALRYVRFDLPNTSQGVLYYDYNASSGTSNDKVTANTSYYRTSTPALDKVTFVPASGYTGEVSIPYTAWDTDGGKFTGKVVVTVKAGPSASVIRYTTSASPVTFQSQDFVNACSARSEGTLTSVRFALPDSSFGRLYYGYQGPSQYESVVNANTAYSPAGTPTLAKITFLPHAGFQGTVPITYTGTDSSGQTYTGSVEISVYVKSASAHFNDMGSYGWAASAVDFLYESGVVKGVNGNQFNPSGAITRGDFTLMLYRAFHLTGTGGNFNDVPAGSYYAEAIAAAKALGIAQGGADGKFHPAQTITRQDAMVLLQRTMRAVGWSLSDGSSSTLARYTDGSSVSSYAVGAVACMVQYNIIQGTSAGTVSPLSPVTRGEMAVILYRALTL